LGAILTGGQRHDAPQLPTLLNHIIIPTSKGYRSRPGEVVADKAYTGKPTRKYLRGRGIKALIPEKKLPKNKKRRQKGPHHRFNEQTYKERNVIERLINHLKECRRFATRFEKLAAQFLALVHLAFIRILLKRYFSDTL
jgi:transposase